MQKVDYSELNFDEKEINLYENLSNAIWVDHLQEVISLLKNSCVKNLHKVINCPESPRGVGGGPLIVLAAQIGNLEIVKLLIDNGANIEIKHNNIKGSNALIIATSNRKYNVVKYLLSVGADVNSVNDAGNTALYVAAANGVEDIAELLISHKADVNLLSKYNQTPLHAACYNSHNRIITMLAKNGANVGIKDSDGETVFDYFKKNGNTAGFELLKEFQNSGSKGTCMIAGLGLLALPLKLLDMLI